MVLVDANEVEGEIWWRYEGVVEKVMETVRFKMGVEACWRERREW